MVRSLIFQYYGLSKNLMCFMFNRATEAFENFPKGLFLLVTVYV